MVSNYGVIADGIVVNAVLAEEDFAAEQGWVLLPEGVGPKWLYDGSSFSPPLPPAPPTPEEISALRLEAYRNQSDPIFFQAQRGLATMDEWLAKVAEIEALYPKEA